MKKLFSVLLALSLALSLSACATEADVDKAYDRGYDNGYITGYDKARDELLDAYIYEHCDELLGEIFLYVINETEFLDNFLPTEKGINNYEIINEYFLSDSVSKEDAAIAFLEIWITSEDLIDKMALHIDYYADNN